MGHQREHEHGASRQQTRRDDSAAARTPDLAPRVGNAALQRLIRGAISRSASEPAPIDEDVGRAIEAARGAGRPLDPAARPDLESALGDDFSDVRVHTDASADRLSRDLEANAFTTGSDIFFRSGTYEPLSSAGRQLLAHELTHVVQQRGAPPAQELRVTDPGDASEREAEAVAEQVARSPAGRAVARESVEEEERDEPPLPSREQVLTLQRSAGNAAVTRLLVARKRARPEDSGERHRWDEANPIYEAFKKRGHGLSEQIRLRAHLQTGSPIAAVTPKPEDMKSYAENYDDTAPGPRWDEKGGFLVITSLHRKEAADVYHINYFYPDGRIEANANYGKAKKADTKTLHNNTILWIQYLKAREWMSKEKPSEGMPVAPAELKRSPIVNRDTNKVIWMCLRDNEESGEFTDASDDMKALLGTENGLAAAFMIIENGVAKGISSITASLAGRGELTIRFREPATQVQTPVLDTAKLEQPKPVAAEPAATQPAAAEPGWMEVDAMLAEMAQLGEELVELNVSNGDET